MTNKILCVGLSTVDIQFLVDSYPGANQKQKAKQNEIHVGGPATNASIAAAHLGSEVTLVTPVGKNHLSRFIRSDIEHHKVELLDPVSDIKTDPIFASIITTEHSGERSIVSYHPPKVLVENFIGHDIDFNIDIALFDGFYTELAIPLAKICREKGIVTCFDGGSWKPGLEDLLSYIDFALCSNDFHPPGCKIKTDVFHFLRIKGCKEIAITQGHKEILYNQNGSISTIEVNEVDAVDTLGAGDIFHGAFCHFYQPEKTFEQIVAEASEVASHSCKYFGTREWMRGNDN